MKINANPLRFWLIVTVLLALLLGVVSFAITRYVVNKQVDRFSERLLLLSSLRKQAMENYFDTARTELLFWSENSDLLDKQQRLSTYWSSGITSGVSAERLQQLYVRDNPWADGKLDLLDDAGDGSLYSKIHAEFHPSARLFVTERGYYDLFLINPAGDIIYTVEKESDFATNLISGRWRDTGLADVFRRAIEPSNNGNVMISDLAPYGPSDNAPAMFIARAMTGHDGQLLGVLALQLPTDYINTIMAFSAGIGETGETYLIGEDYLMRSNSRFSDIPTVLKTRVDTVAVNKALAGESGTVFADDYRGVEVLSAYNSIELDGFRWAVIAEIDRQEVLQTLAGKRPAFAGFTFLIYALALWSFWYMRTDKLASDEQLIGLSLPDAVDSPDISA